MEKAQNKERVVAISHVGDIHVDMVQPYLDNEITIIDPIKVLEGAELSYHFNGKDSTVVYNDEVLDDVGAVWYRKPATIGEKIMPVDERLQEYAATALRKHVELLRVEFEDANWVSDFYAINRASNKTLQYREASRLGFNVPETVLTSSGEAAHRFINDHSATVVKTLSHLYPRQDDGSPQMFLTRRIDSEANLNGLNLAPAVFQEAVEVNRELRVTVVGDEVFVAAIDNTDEDVRDWRVGHFTGNSTFEAFDDCSDEIKQKCLSLTKQLGLQYGAIDLILDKRGEAWFLEINPNGQWGFVEELTGQQIGRAVARLLVNKR